MGRFDALLSIESKKESKPAVRTQGDAGTRKHTPPPEPVRAKTSGPSGQSDPALPDRPFARTPVRPNGRRIITRNAFELYEDQMDSLRRLAMDEKLNGRLGSMSAMVREAIDTFLKKATTEQSA
jgi:hypothetical protein